MLAGSEEYYNRQQQELTAAFAAAFLAGVFTGTPSHPSHFCGACMPCQIWHALNCLLPKHTRTWGAGDESAGALPLHWRQRVRPRKFGAVLPGDVATCRKVCIQPCHASCMYVVSATSPMPGDWKQPSSVGYACPCCDPHSSEMGKLSCPDLLRIHHISIPTLQ